MAVMPKKLNMFMEFGFVIIIFALSIFFFYAAANSAESHCLMATYVKPSMIENILDSTEVLSFLMIGCALLYTSVYGFVFDIYYFM